MVRASESVLGPKNSSLSTVSEDAFSSNIPPQPQGCRFGAVHINRWVDKSFIACMHRPHQSMNSLSSCHSPNHSQSS